MRFVAHACCAVLCFVTHAALADSADVPASDRPEAAFPSAPSVGSQTASAPTAPAPVPPGPSNPPTGVYGPTQNAQYPYWQQYPWVPPTEPRESSEQTHWYGAETLLVDGASIGLFIAGVAGDASPLVGLGAAGYFLGSPIVHFAHGRPGAAVGSLGLHLGLPVIGAGIGLAAADCHNDHEEGWCGIGEMGIGLLLGIVGATVLDTTLLAHERVHENDVTVLNLGPVIDPHRRSATIAVSGAF